MCRLWLTACGSSPCSSMHDTPSSWMRYRPMQTIGWCLRCTALTVSGVVQVLTRSPGSEVTKEPTRPLPSSASSTSSRTSVDEGGSESGSPGFLSTKQLVFIAADVQKLQDKVCNQITLKQYHLNTFSFGSVLF